MFCMCLLGQTAELDQSLPMDLDPQAVYFYHQPDPDGTTPAIQGTALIGKETKRKDDS